MSMHKQQAYDVCSCTQRMKSLNKFNKIFVKSSSITFHWSTMFPYTDQVQITFQNTTGRDSFGHCVTKTPKYCSGQPPKFPDFIRLYTWFYPSAIRRCEAPLNRHLAVHRPMKRAQTLVASTRTSYEQFYSNKNYSEMAI